MLICKCAVEWDGRLTDAILKIMNVYDHFIVMEMDLLCIESKSIYDLDKRNSLHEFICISISIKLGIKYKQRIEYYNKI